MPSSQIKSGSQLAKVNNLLDWWSDMDHLVAELAGQNVSLNLKDCALNSWLRNSFEERITNHGRRSFWQELVARYRNRPATEEILTDSVKLPFNNLKLNAPEPAYEFAEEFDG
jgi:hypothetical protein